MYQINVKAITMNFDDYKNKRPYPTKSDHVTLRLHDKKSGEVLHETLSSHEATEIINEDPKLSVLVGGALRSNDHENVAIISAFMVVAVYNKAAYDTEMYEYHNITHELYQKFEDDLAQEHAVTPRSKLHRVIYGKAWEDGHSSGLSEVANHYDELVDFAEEIHKAYNEQ